ncbi:pirin family protein [uncultured Oceanisphaera sp.]|uniref:pirin family protein n=1 Tax=uncultured Oceanisphaera sp. TaxID=353858 RepID=UPI00261989AD|nr:pirin family protein [uncultured Oceanisphaera sp.]
MSNPRQTVTEQCDLVAGCGAIQQLIHPRDKDLGGFCVRRTLPNQAIRQIGPWVFFDHMGPATFAVGDGIDVRPHPHINIATVTYLFEGEIVHRDSIGSEQLIRPGDLNLMVTGSGMVHSEREPPEVKNRPHTVHGLQLWLALPEKDEETDPAFYHYPADDLPRVNLNDVSVRIMMGAAYGAISPVRTFSPTLYIEARLKEGQTLELPNAAQRGLYVLNGDISLRDTRVPRHTMVVLNDDEDVVIKAEQDTQIALIGGDDIGSRYMDWNFVSSSKERIEAAKMQWKARRFPIIKNDADEFIPYPTSKG